MSLRDHFHPPLHPRHHWESFYSNWATRIADQLNEKWLPPEFLAEEYTVFPDVYEVQVSTRKAGPKLVGAIELVGPGNKEQLQERRAFAAKCVSYLHRGISLVVIDIVTNRKAM